jgi:hypothetical protein
MESLNTRWIGHFGLCGSIAVRMVFFVGSLSIHKQKMVQGSREEEICRRFFQHLVFVLFLLMRESA